MSMDDLQEKDWLDQRLAATAYLPDDGFTVRVVEKLPHRPRRAFSRRTFILFVATFAAICLVASQLIPLFQAAVGLVAEGSLDHLVAVIGKSLQQPAVLLGCGGGMALLTLGAYPLLKRLA
jgi:hypothetical protein